MKKKLLPYEIKINRVKEICKIGQLEKCCKYLVCGVSGFECAKLNKELKSKIDNRINLNAKGDNCEGVEND